MIHKVNYCSGSDLQMFVVVTGDLHLLGEMWQRWVLFVTEKTFLILESSACAESRLGTKN